jgi:hypothetical protein
MSDRLSFSIFTIEVDGKPTLAFEAGDEGLRAKLSLLTAMSLERKTFSCAYDRARLGSTI